LERHGFPWSASSDLQELSDDRINIDFWSGHIVRVKKMGGGGGGGEKRVARKKKGEKKRGGSEWK